MSEKMNRLPGEGIAQPEVLELNVSLYSHPDGEGSIQLEGDLLRVTNECDCSEAVVTIGVSGMRALARKLNALADLCDVEVRK